jgi:GTP-binding protein LepA
MASGASVTAIEMGYFLPHMHAIGNGEKLSAGEVGYIATGLKDVRFAKVGDTITITPDHPNHPDLPDISPLPGYKEPKPMVFLSLFPINSEEFSYARETMEKLRLSDSAFTFRPISSLALGNGFHCGFLGLLHAEIVQERLSREFNLNMIATAPSVEYKLKVKSEKLKVEQDGFMHIQSANEYPDPTFIDQTLEPVMNVTIYTPKRYVGPVMQLAQEKRGTFVDLKYQADQAEFTYLIPLSEMIIDFFDRLKSVTEGYASLDYEFFEYSPVDVAKIDILVNKEKVDALSFLVVRAQAHLRSLEITDRLAAIIPRAQFEVPIQAAIGGKVVARSDVKAFRKDVIQKLYGGDRTRKDKLLKKQKKGKARMKLVGRVEIPQEAFFEVLKRD